MADAEIAIRNGRAYCGENGQSLTFLERGLGSDRRLPVLEEISTMEIVDLSILVIAIDWVTAGPPFSLSGNRNSHLSYDADSAEL